MSIILRKTTVTPPTAAISTLPKTTLEAVTIIMKTTIKTKTKLPTTQTKTGPSSSYLSMASGR
jgi:hypothetical protein